ncbi:MAG: hypothetical protein HYV07_19150 [Deltaproteobacteria bacterium]|nr:hypothetical protein [Deltaproteobacteria bacterium]
MKSTPTGTRKGRNLRRHVLVLAPGLLMACASAPPASAPTAIPKMPESTYLTEGVRQQVRGLMTHHGKEVEPLLWSTLFLDLDWTAQHAEALARGPRLRQLEDPNLPKDELVPERLMKLDAELSEKARVLQEVATSKDSITPGQLADAFGETVKVCVRCHATYLFPDDRVSRMSAQ